VRIFNKSAVEFYASRYAPARGSLRAWYAVAVASQWLTPEHVKAAFPKASIIANNRVVFDITGSKYRLIVSFNYKFLAGYIKFFGTHAEYDRINGTVGASSVDHTGVQHD
jgi:mRNA interferase HigB